MVIFVPTVQYLAGLQIIATAERGLAAAILWVLLAAVVNVAIVWIFLTAYLAAPGRTKRHLDKASTWVDWVKAHSDLIVRIVLAVAGLYLVISGIHGLTSA
jgi:arginine exporter protein ArgO